MQRSRNSTELPWGAVTLLQAGFHLVLTERIVECDEYCTSTPKHHTSLTACKPQCRQTLLGNFPVWPPRSHSGTHTHPTWARTNHTEHPTATPGLLTCSTPTAESQTSRPLNWFDLGAITRYQNKCSSWCLRDTLSKTVPHCQPWGLTASQHAGIVLKNPSFFEIYAYFSGHGGSLNREAQNVQCQSAKEVQTARRC